jgi:hypothetical protein
MPAAQWSVIDWVAGPDDCPGCQASSAINAARIATEARATNQPL